MTDEQALRIGEAIILQAVEDLQNEHVYKSPSRENQKLLDQQSALDFFRGPWFTVIADAINVDANKIRQKALT